MKQKLLAEFIGTFALILFGCGSIMVGSEAVPLVFGAIVATMIYTLGHISGAHFNPAVTFAFVLTRHFPVSEAFPYILAQCLGAIASSGVLSLLFPDAANFGATTPQVPIITAFCWEILLSFFLMFVIMSVATDTRAEGIMAGIAIGIIVALAALIGGNATGASMNPARSIAPAIFEGNFAHLWLYLTAPFLGSLLGGFTYQYIRCDSGKNGAKGCC